MYDFQYLLFTEMIITGSPVSNLSVDSFIFFLFFVVEGNYTYYSVVMEVQNIK